MPRSTTSPTASLGLLDAVAIGIGGIVGGGFPVVLVGLVGGSLVIEVVYRRLTGRRYAHGLGTS